MFKFKVGDRIKFTPHSGKNRYIIKNKTLKRGNILTISSRGISKLGNYVVYSFVNSGFDDIPNWSNIEDNFTLIKLSPVKIRGKYYV